MSNNHTSSHPFQHRLYLMFLLKDLQHRFLTNSDFCTNVVVVPNYIALNNFSSSRIRNAWTNRITGCTRHITNYRISNVLWTKIRILFFRWCIFGNNCILKPAVSKALPIFNPCLMYLQFFGCGRIQVINNRFYGFYKFPFCISIGSLGSNRQRRILLSDFNSSLHNQFDPS
jgi:hypothetical protein